MSKMTREVLVKVLSKGKRSLAEETTACEEEKKESSDLPHVDAVQACAKSGEEDLESGLSQNAPARVGVSRGTAKAHLEGLRCNIIKGW